MYDCYQCQPIVTLIIILYSGPLVRQWQHSHLSPLRPEFKSQPDLMWESGKLLANGLQFTVQNLDQLYVLVSSAFPTNYHNITDKVLGVINKINDLNKPNKYSVFWFMLSEAVSEIRMLSSMSQTYFLSKSPGNFLQIIPVMICCNINFN